MVNKGKVAKKEARKKLKQNRTIVIENAELLSKEQLKKAVKNPSNNIRASGKRKRKMLKRLRHSEKDKNSMQVEKVEVAKKGQVQSKSDIEMTEKQSDASDQDEEME